MKATHTANEVMAHAREMELKGVDFLNAQGSYAKKHSRVAFVRWYFHDGKEFMLSREESDKLDDFNFKLRPSRDDA